jgi:hypothetical protein
VGNSLVVAGKLRDRSHAGAAVFGHRTNTDPDFFDLRAFERRNHPSGMLQQLVRQGVFRPGVVAFERLISPAVVQDDTSRTVGTQVDVSRVDKPTDGRPFYGDA